MMILLLVIEVCKIENKLNIIFEEENIFINDCCCNRNVIKGIELYHEYIPGMVDVGMSIPT